MVVVEQKPAVSPDVRNGFSTSGGRHFHRCWAEIDLATLQANIAAIRAALPASVEYCAVVKADAYGHGVGPIAAAAFASGVKLFAVANPHEARQVLIAAPESRALVFGSLFAGELEAFADGRMIATVSDEAEAVLLEQLAQRLQRKLALQLKVDTGMGRLGVWQDQALPLFRRLRASQWLRIEGIYSHLPQADCNLAYTLAQKEHFERILGEMRELDDAHQAIVSHIDNSAGLTTFQAFPNHGIVRVGLLQYGENPMTGTMASPIPVQPVLSWYARVGLVKTLPAGTAISYGGRHTLARESRVAVLTVGYGDGYGTALSNRAEVLLRGRRCPILGRVTMDQIMVDVTALESTPLAGEVATLIGVDGRERITANELAARSGAIPWEIFCALSPRVKRIYRHD
jgi:alanine racemase